jgi:transcriptional regulator with XRE-family HTH domain
VRVKKNPVDEMVGRQVALAITQMGLSVQQVASELSVKSIEIEEFCSGRKRFRVSHLFALSQLLGKPISYFFLPLADDTEVSRDSKTH